MEENTLIESDPVRWPKKGSDPAIRNEFEKRQSLTIPPDDSLAATIEL